MSLSEREDKALKRYNELIEREAHASAYWSQYLSTGSLEMIDQHRKTKLTDAENFELTLLEVELGL